MVSFSEVELLTRTAGGRTLGFLELCQNLNGILHSGTHEGVDLLDLAGSGQYLGSCGQRIAFAEPEFAQQLERVTHDLPHDRRVIEWPEGVPRVAEDRVVRVQPDSQGTARERSKMLEGS